MSTDTITHTARLPHGYEVEFAWLAESRHLRVRWSPDVPRIASTRHRRKFFETYAAARRDFMRDVATSIGGSVGIADLTGEFECVRPATKH